MNGGELEKAARVLDVWTALVDLTHALLNNPAGRVQDALDVWMDMAKRNRRRLAVLAHPDHGGSVDRMQEINSAFAALQQWRERVRGVKTLERPRFVAVTISFNAAGNVSAHTITSSGGFYG